MPKDYSRIVAEESAAFLDSQFSELDAPSLQTESAAHKRLVARVGRDDETDPRFSPLADDRPKSLVRKLNGLLEQSSRDPQLAEELRRAGVDTPAQARTFHTGGFTVTVHFNFATSNWEFAASNDSGGEMLDFDVEGLGPGDFETAIGTATEHIRKTQPRKLWRELDEEDRLTVLRMARIGNLQDAALTYITRALRGYDLDHDPSTDPKYRALYEEAAWFLFQETEPGWCGSEEQRAFFDHYLAGRVVDLGLLRSAFQAWKAASGAQAVQEHQVVVPDAEDELDIDEMTDEEVRTLYRGVAREFARQARR